MGIDAVIAHHGIIGATASEQATVHARMQCLESTIHQLGETGVVGYFAHRQAGIGQQPRAAASRQQFNATAM